MKACFTGLMLMLGLIVGAAAAPLVDKSTSTLEEKLASINAGRWVRTDDITIARFRFLVKSLQDVVELEPTTIGDMLVRAHKMVTQEYGKQITLLELTEAAYEHRLEAEPGRQGFAELLAVLVNTIGRQPAPRR
jgi:hypothetical protein